MKNKLLFGLLLLTACAGKVERGPDDNNVARAAEREVRPEVVYDPAYVRLRYPGGDVPGDRGVCADVVVRVYRRLGIDLQRLIHEDRVAQGLPTDPNIDHRRVVNLMDFFEHHATVLPLNGEYRPGDVVCWALDGGRYHTGVVVNRRRGDHCLVLHNIGAGQVVEDVLYAFPAIGHYRYNVQP